MTNRFEKYGEPRAPANRFSRYSRIDQGTAFLRAFGNSASIGAGDEIMGFGAGVGALARGDNFLDAYNEQTARSRANLEEARQDRPVSALAGEIGGYFVPGIGVGRMAIRGGGLATRLASSAGVGAGFGGAYGLASGENLQERLEGGATGAALGGVFGAGAHAVLGEALPAVWGAGRRALGLPQSGGRMGVAERARDDLVQAARQNERLGVRDFNDLGPVIQQAAARDPSMTVAEALGRSAINRVVKYSRLPGRTAERAEQVLERNADTFDELTTRLDDTLTPRGQRGEALSMRDASGELDAAFTRASTEGYQRALAQPMPPGVSGSIQQIIQRHPEFYQRAMQEAQIIARGEGITGFQGINDPRVYHYLKVGASDVLRTMRREGLGATRARQYTQSIRNLIDELDRVPGYRDARQTWGSLSEAREALEAGFGFDRMRPAELSELAARLTPFQRRYLQAGVSERIRDTLARRDNDGLVNIARDLTNRRRGELMRAAFGDKAGPLDDFLQYARLRRQMHADARRMASSQESPTGIVTGEGLADAIPTGAISLKAGAMRLAYNNTIGRLGERNRDVLGRILLTPVGEFNRAGRGLLSRANREASRRQAKTRLLRTRGAYLTGVGAYGFGNERDNY